MKIFMCCSLSLALVFLLFSLSSAHFTFSQSQEHQASSQSEAQHSSSQNQESHASSQSQEGYASSQSQLGGGSSQSIEYDASSKSQGSLGSSQSQGHNDASSKSQGNDASSQSQGNSDASSKSQGNNDASSKSQGNDASSQSQGTGDASSKSQGNEASTKNQGQNDASSKSQGNDASTKNQGNEASSKSQGTRDASSKSQGNNDASSKSQGNEASNQSQSTHDASSKKKGRDSYRRRQGHDASSKSQSRDASSKSKGRDSYRRRQGHDASSSSQGNEASSQNQGHDTSSSSQGYDATSQGNDTSSSSQGYDATSQGFHASFNFNGSYKGCFSKVYAFGGSDMDTGNANVLGGRLDANSEKSKGRLGDGRLVVDFLCDALSLPEISAYKEVNVNSTQASVNFAVAGSTAFTGDFFSTHNLSSLIWKDSPKLFQTQIEWFNKFLIDTGCKGPRGGGLCDIPNSLFWVGEMGVADFMSAVGSSLPLPHLTEISVRIVCELLKAMLDNGARYVVVQGLPPVGCLPAYMSSGINKEDRDHMGCVASANIGIISYNQILQERLAKFRKLYPDCSILYADYWNAYLTILANPSKYQIEEPFKACCEEKTQLGIFTINRHSLFGSQSSTTCKDPSKYISWDGIHLTEAMNKKLTALFLNEGFCKPSFSALVQAKLKV